ncbi:MAG: hypothetical protein SGJ01_02725 [Gemmatimonadota bacterium]|nr:hypothetical protein [Gemmatimonadota bacterium]
MMRASVLVLVVTFSARLGRAQAIDTEGRAAIAVADSGLAALTSGDSATLARLTLDSAVVGGMDTWSHCGVDVFTLMKSEGRWRVAALVYTVEQPPVCRKHPAGPPAH